ncbi:hypothetical protein L289_3272 [Acinetobacter gerneri DSM 14967 = CIP 107464 = MTCC 9824]|nr:hypothetical protein L289_3272 [Acinetobacter gerneri DSM 14967 = CIP 107464 = MTCC 9824]
MACLILFRKDQYFYDFRNMSILPSLLLSCQKNGSAKLPFSYKILLACIA